MGAAHPGTATCSVPGVEVACTDAAAAVAQVFALIHYCALLQSRKVLGNTKIKGQVGTPPRVAEGTNISRNALLRGLASRMLAVPTRSKTQYQLQEKEMVALAPGTDAASDRIPKLKRKHAKRKEART